MKLDVTKRCMASDHLKSATNLDEGTHSIVLNSGPDVKVMSGIRGPNSMEWIEKTRKLENYSPFTFCILQTSSTPERVCL